MPHASGDLMNHGPTARLADKSLVSRIPVLVPHLNTIQAAQNNISHQLKRKP
jgi:hypothetical protein